jgi:glycosyltransferase involved in cell wall biosynthesis
MSSRMLSAEPRVAGQTRVLRLITRMNVGGAALQAASLSEGLDPESFESRLVTGRLEPGEADYLALRAPKVRSTRVASLARAPRPDLDVQAFAHVVREIRRFRPHIVHTHTTKAGVIGRIAARLCGVPALVHTYHGHLLRGHFGPAKTQAIIWAERLLAASTTRLVAVGQRVRDDLLAAGIGRPEQYVVVPPGIDLPPPPPREAARRQLELAGPAPVVAYVGRLTAIKRPERFVEVAARLRADHPDVRFVVCGEGDLLDRVRRQAEPLGPGMRFLGWRRDVETVLAAADIVVLTSDSEGMPVSLIEASLVGRPVVATRVGSTAEVVLDGVTGLLTVPDAAAIAAAVGRLLDDPDLRSRMGSSAGEHAARCFGRARLIKDTERLYRELLEPR